MYYTSLINESKVIDPNKNSNSAHFFVVTYFILVCSAFPVKYFIKPEGKVTITPYLSNSPISLLLLFLPPLSSFLLLSLLFLSLSISPSFSYSLLPFSLAACHGYTIICFEECVKYVDRIICYVKTEWVNIIHLEILENLLFLLKILQ